MLTVLQVTPELNAGGVERTTLEIAHAVKRAGGLALIASAGGRLERDLEAAGGELVRLPLASKNPATMFANAARLERVIRERKVDIVHARSRAPAWSALVAARRAGVHFVTTYHGIYNAKSALKRWYNGVMAKGDIVIANSEYTRTHVLETYGLAPERVVAIPRGVDIDKFDPEKISAERIASWRRSFQLAEDDFALILPARLTRWKGQLLLIDALARMKARGEAVPKLILAGDAQGRSHYVREIMDALASAGLEQRVVLAGHVSNIAEAIAACDAAVFPSLDPEAFGRGAIEAQALAKPVIAAAHGGLAETVVDGQTGFLFAPGDVADLDASLARLRAMNGAERAHMGNKGRARVCALYTTEMLQKFTLSVYDRLMGAKP